MISAQDPQLLASLHDPDAVRLVEITQYYWITQAVGSIVRLKVPDVFGEEPMAVIDVAGAVGCDAAALERILRSLTGVGVVVEEPDGRFRLGRIGQLLRSDHPASMCSLAVLHTEPWMCQVFQQMPITLRDGIPGVRPVLGVDDYWTYLKKNPQARVAFNEGMTAAARALQIPAALAYDYARVQSVLDVGGGLGHLLTAVLQVHSHLHGSVLDLPDTVQEARTLLADNGVAERATVIAGDMFEQVPPGFDLYLLSLVLMDWDDQRAGQLLANISTVMPKTGRVLVVDCLSDMNTDGKHSVEIGHPFHLGRTVDLFQMCMGSARVRSRAEFEALFAQAGLSIRQIVQPQGPISLLELEHRP
jgi:C-methyltransferase